MTSSTKSVSLSGWNLKLPLALTWPTFWSRMRAGVSVIPHKLTVASGRLQLRRLLTRRAHAVAVHRRLVQRKRLKLVVTYSWDDQPATGTQVCVRIRGGVSVIVAGFVVIDGNEVVDWTWRLCRLGWWPGRRGSDSMAASRRVLRWRWWGLL